jgi:prophage regulatory protein
MYLMLKRFNEVCDLLSLSRDGLRKVQIKDPTFPKPIKLGNSKQAPVFFDIKELEQWLELKKAERAGEFEA